MGAGICCICDKHKRHVGMNETAGGLLCGTCYSREFAPRRKCTRCGKQRPVHAYLSDEPYCNTCYKREILLAVCAFCRIKRRLHARDPEHRRPTCLSCWDERFAPREPCMLCGEDAVAEMRGPKGECICHRCWHNEFRPREPCVRCGHERVACKRTARGGSICTPCWFDERPAARCPYCKQMRKLMHREDGDWICRRCYPKFLAPKRACTECGALEATHYWRTDTQPLCQRCYAATEQPSARCAVCRRVARVAKRRDDGAAICHRCYERARKHATHASDATRSS